MPVNGELGGQSRAAKRIWTEKGGIWVPAKTLHIGDANRAYRLGYQDEKVVTLASRGDAPVLKALFSAEDWTSDVRKRVVIPAGVEIGTYNATYAIATTISADGQAGSFGGELVFDNYGTISGLGGIPNSGMGGNCIWGNFPGRDGQKLIVNNYGLMRSGGGGGGRAGNGGTGLVQDWQDSGYQYQNPYSWHWESQNEITKPETYRTTKCWIGGAEQWAQQMRSDATVADVGGWRWYRGALRAKGSQTWQFYEMRRHLITPNNYFYNGGNAPNAGRGQGYDGARTAGGQPVGGATNAGASGRSGNGGDWGATGEAGGNGASGNYGGGTAGATGGLAGGYLYGSTNIQFNNFGTALGRLL